MEKDQQEGNKFVRSELIEIAIDDVNWKILYKNPTTGEYWKEFFPHAEMHGGGPPTFEQITEDEARREFKF